MHVFQAELKTILIPFLSGKGTKLAAKYAIVRVVDVAIDNVSGLLPIFLDAELIGGSSQSV